MDNYVRGLNMNILNSMDKVINSINTVRQKAELTGKQPKFYEPESHIHQERIVSDKVEPDQTEAPDL